MQLQLKSKLGDLRETDASFLQEAVSAAVRSKSARLLLSRTATTPRRSPISV